MKIVIKVIKETAEYLKNNNIDVNLGLELLWDMEMYDETIDIFFEGLKERISKSFVLSQLWYETF